MDYSFDEIVDRRNTDSIKYAAWQGNAGDLLPLWVADMDFKAPQEVIEALKARCEHGIFGYSDVGSEDYFTPLHDWYLARFGWETAQEQLVKTPGVVFAIHMAIKALTKKGDAVLIQQPVYYPFMSAIKDTGRTMAVSPLKYADGRYTMDFENFENTIIQNKVKLFILCSPHNPVGRVWTKAELSTMGDICLKHGVYVISDEIHADFVYSGYQHTVFASIKPEFAEMSVICTAPSKTFNLAGLQVSNIFIPNAEIRQKFERKQRQTGYGEPNLMGLAACKAAYLCGGPWLDALKVYLADNLSFVRAFLAERLPEIKLVEPEGTYLIWLDFSALGLTPGQLGALITEKAQLWLDDGTIFGGGGEGFQRINIACPRQILSQAMERLADAFEAL